MNIRPTLMNILRYDPQSGDFIWLENRGRSGKKGDRAGTITRDGYVRIRSSGVNMLAHRLAWLFVYGSWPKLCIDHIDGDRSNNRIANLRDVSLGVNQQNRRHAMPNNKTSGLLGVSFQSNRGLWVASIGVNGKRKHLGRFSSPQDAYLAYLTAKRQFHEGNTL